MSENPAFNTNISETMPAMSQVGKKPMNVLQDFGHWYQYYQKNVSNVTHH